MASLFPLANFPTLPPRLAPLFAPDTLPKLSKYTDVECDKLLKTLKLSNVRKFKQQQRRRLRECHLKCEFALPQTFSRSFHLV